MFSSVIVAHQGHSHKSSHRDQFEHRQVYDACSCMTAIGTDPPPSQTGCPQRPDYAECTISPRQPAIPAPQ